ncbi:hypothetical protein KEM54_001217 [Ascosphaera aggregata]|nr:hypothetical protein KEM54_001217 [Ascosphaera aggregata]
MSNPTQLLLLTDHIKLSLLEWQRAKTLDLEPNSQEGEIARSLESLRLGIEAAEKKQKKKKESDGDDEARREYTEQIADLRLQYQDLMSQFTGKPSSTTTTTTTTSSVSKNSGVPSQQASAIKKNSVAESEDPPPQHIINSTTTIRQPKPQHPKSVRFTDASHEQDFEYMNNTTLIDDDAARAALFPYKDDPSSSATTTTTITSSSSSASATASSPPDYDHSNLSNPDILMAQQQIVREQDDQLDRLGESIGRQHQLSIQIGDELEEQVQLLDDVDRHVDRNQNRMDSARQRLGRIRRGSNNDRKGICAIVALIVVLIILIIILK